MLAIVPPWRIFNRFYGHVREGYFLEGGIFGTDCMLFLNVEFELNTPGTCGGYSELH